MWLKGEEGERIIRRGEGGQGEEEGKRVWTLNSEFVEGNQNHHNIKKPFFFFVKKMGGEEC